MAQLPASDFLKKIESGDWNNFDTDFIDSCRTWDGRKVQDFGPIVLKLYEMNTAESLNTLTKILANGTVYRRGPWQGVKKLFKTAEQKNDARIFGLVSHRCDVGSYAAYGAFRGISGATRAYLKRRTWRALRKLGKKRDATNYVAMALAILEHYEENQLSSYLRCKLWVYNHIGWHGSVRGDQPGNGANYYTVTRWRQREKKRNRWARDEWKANTFTDYAFPTLWRGQLKPIIDTLGRVKAETTAKLLIEILRRECPAELATLTIEQVLGLFSSSLPVVLEFALQQLQGLPVERVPVDVVIKLLDHKQATVVSAALQLLSKIGFARLGTQLLMALAKHANEQVASWAVRMVRQNANAKDIAWETLKAWLDAKHPNIRKDTLEFIDANWAVWSPTTKMVLDLLDTIHPDVHKVVFKWLLQKFDFKAFDREDVFDLFDSEWEDVRQFGRDLLRKHFDELRALEDLGRLAEHPEPGMQHWVVSLVKQYLSADADRLIKLLPFFRVVLFHVNHGADEKQLILQMLVEMAATSRARAEAVVKLCAEFVRAYGRAEFVKSLVGLARLRHLYADIDVPVELLPVPSRAAK